MGLAALIAAIISGFGFAIGYGLAVALARKIPGMAEKVPWALMWRTAPARIFAVVTFGFGIIGLLCGWGLYLLKRKRKERVDDFIASIGSPNGVSAKYSGSTRPRLFYTFVILGN